jgi:hypothetical protein
MAFKSVNSNKYEGEVVKAIDMEIGEPLTAYVTGIDSYEYDGKDFNNLLMQREDGSEFKLLTCGNLAYNVKDGKLKVGLLTQITKTADKGGQVKRTTFDVQQDAEKTIAVVDALDKALGQGAPMSAMRTQSVGVSTITAATEKAATNAIKNRAKEIAAANKR